MEHLPATEGPGSRPASPSPEPLEQTLRSLELMMRAKAASAGDRSWGHFVCNRCQSRQRRDRLVRQRVQRSCCAQLSRTRSQGDISGASPMRATSSRRRLRCLRTPGCDHRAVPWRRVATYGTAAILLALGVLLFTAPDAIPGLTIPGGNPMHQQMNRGARDEARSGTFPNSMSGSGCGGVWGAVQTRVGCRGRALPQERRAPELTT